MAFASSAVTRPMVVGPAARLVCLAAALAIAGCAAPTPSTQAAGAAPSSAPSSPALDSTPQDPPAAGASSTPSPPSVQNSPVTDGQPGESREATKPDNEGAPPSVAQAPSITQLIGLSAGQLQQRLGPAGFVRRDGAAEIWRYSVDDCHVDLFLYREESGPRVQHIEARPRNGGRINVRTCYERLLATRRLSMAG